MRLGQRRIFYGWVIVAGLMCSSAVITAMGGVNSGQFIKPMTEELGIGQTWFGWAQTARLLSFAASSWVIGRLIDARGARLPMVTAGAVMGLVLLGLSQVQEGWQIVVLFGIAGLTGLQGAGGNLYNSVPLSRWFVRKRGRAMSVAFLGTPIGIFLFAPLTQFLIDDYGWRTAWMALGATGAMVVGAVALLIVRRAPEDMGLLPDGDAAPAPVMDWAGVPRAVASAEYSWTRAEAIRTPTFRRLAAVDGLRMVAVATLGLFRIPFYVDQGIDAGVVALALSAEALVGMAITVPVGWAVDRFQPRYISAFATATMITTFLVTIFVSTPVHVFVATILLASAP
ncbi:MAG: MFS transporter [Dehalococcoidia bacterium]|nr:MFS transporter [Dehalococcoidia bacterium]